MQDRVCLITGATSGIGQATARSLAAQGAELYIVCRNAEKGAALRNSIAGDAEQSRIHLLVGDLASFADIRCLAQTFLDTGKPLHLLINNAGVVNTRRQLSRDGIEATFAVNHLGYFLLTELLRERLIASAPSRIVSVASNAYNFVDGVHFDDVEFKDGPYKTFKVYGHSKLCNILWTRELARQLEGSGVTANCLHPGAVRSGLGQQDHPLLGKLVFFLLRPFFISPEQGAATSLYLATSDEVKDISGEYFANGKIKSLKAHARDPEAGRRLWEVSKAYVDARA